MRRLLLGTSLATVAVSLVCLILTPPHPGLPRNFQSPVVAGELVRNAAEIEQVYGTALQAGHCGSPDYAASKDCVIAARLRLITWIDFLLIPSYALTYFLLGRLISNRLGWLVMALAPIAALADVAENIGILHATAEAATDALALAIRTPSLVKWTALALMWLAFIAVFWARYRASGASLGWRLAEAATGLLYGLGGGLCLAGILGDERMIEAGVRAAGLAILLQIPVLWHDHGLRRGYALAGD